MLLHYLKEKFDHYSTGAPQYGFEPPQPLRGPPSPSSVSPNRRPMSLFRRLNSFRKASLLSFSSNDGSSPRNSLCLDGLSDSQSLYYVKREHFCYQCFCSCSFLVKKNVPLSKRFCLKLMVFLLFLKIH